MEKQKNKKQGFVERIRSLFIQGEIPQRPPAGYRIELFGQKNQTRVLVSGARRILICSDEQVVLETKEKMLCFNGEGLDFLCYEGGVAEICGDVKSFSFAEVERV